MSCQVKARELEDKSKDETSVPVDGLNAVVIASKPASNTKSSKGLNQQFLDLFWKLADKDASTRLSASLEVIKHIESAHSSVSLILYPTAYSSIFVILFLFLQDSQLSYTVGRLVQGLASNRECARHGYYITLVGILKSVNTTRLTNQTVHDAIKNRLEAEGNKKV